MKYLNKLKLVLLVSAIFCFSCEKHTVEYDAIALDDATSAQFQLFYMVPISSGTANNINKVEVNNELLTNETTPLSVFNFIPSGAVGRFFATEPGDVNLKLYRGAVTSLTQAYDQTFNLPAGKHNVVVHDFDKPPVILGNNVPYPSITTENTGTTAWVRFFNFMYESPGVPTSLKIQYQFQYTIDNETGEKSEWANLGDAVSFGEATGYEPVTVNKTVEVSAGTARIDYRIRLIGQDGSDQGSLQVQNASGNIVDYSDWWNASVGRVYNHMFSGYRAGAIPNVGIRLSSAL